MAYWAKRTSLEKCLMLVIGVLFLFGFALLLKPLVFPSGKKLDNVCMTESCVRDAAQILQSMDPTVDPCEDFYKFACGNFIKSAYIREDQTWSSFFIGIYDNLAMRLRQIIEEPIQPHDLHYLKLMKMLYSSCMNDTNHQQENLKYITRLVKDLGGWPILEGNNWNIKNFDWKNLLFKFRKLNLRRNVFIGLYIGVDDKNSTRRILTISQPCMNIDNVKKGLNDTTVKAYHDLIIKSAILLGADPANAAAEVMEVTRFRIQMANIMVPSEQRKNSSLEYNLMTISELQEHYPSFNWLQYINSYLSPIETVTYNEVVNVNIPKYLRDIEKLLQSTSKRILANYMIWTIFWDHFEYFPDSFQKLSDEYVRILYGKVTSTPRWKECLGEISRFQVGMSSIYVKKFFKKSAKDKVVELVADIKGSFIETLKKTGWMDRKTKIHALQKAELMQTLIAYPEEVLNDQKVEEIYKDIHLDPNDSYLEMSNNISIFWRNYGISQYRQPVIKGDWKNKAYSYVMNAFYAASDNSIELQAGMLQAPFFDEDRLQYLNYGAIGYVIGHEITHGFDDGGRQYDKDGNLVDWWEPETNKTFSNKVQCLVEQYGNFTVPDLNLPLNGEKTLGENIADNGGIKIAYRGYEKWIERNGNEPMLPGLNYNAKQMFWVSAASIWCTKYRKEALKQYVASGSHAPSYFRVTIPFMNSDFFAKDFKCPLGTPMNPKYKCRVW